MLLVSKIKASLSGASPFLIHIFMVVSVTIYTLMGAIVMRYIENKEINEQLPQKDMEERVVLNGHELSLLAPELHNCVANSINSLMELTKCDDRDIDYFIITSIDDCYRNAKIVLNRSSTPSSKLSSNPRSKYGEKGFQGDLEEQWSFANAVVFSYTVITTIGYGHVAPVTFPGRLFCIFYGLVGIPLTLLTIADIGMFLSRIVKQIVVEIQKIQKFFIDNILKRFKKDQSETDSLKKEIEERTKDLPEELQSMTKTEEESEFSEEQKGEERSTAESITLFVIFILYLISGAFVISLYEPDMGMFKAFYFIFVSCTTVGLGDLVPRSYKYLVITFIYITIGLSLTTMAVEIAAEYLKKLHYFGRKIESVAQVEVWFGGKKMKLKNLIKHLGDQMNVPTEDLKNLNIDNFVDSAIKVKEGELKSLRKPKEIMREDGRPLSYRDLRKSGEPSIFYADERSSIVTVSLAKCVVPLLDLQNSPTYAHQADSLSPIEKIVEFFHKAKDYLGSSAFFPVPLQKIVPVNDQLSNVNTKLRMTNPVESFDPWSRPVPVREFYPLKAVIPNSEIKKRSYEIKPHPIRIRELKNKFGHRNKYVDGIKWRKKREAYRQKEFSGLSNLEKIDNYYKMSRHVEKFIKKLNDANSQFINNASDIPFKFELKKDKNMTLVENVFQAVGSAMGVSKDKFSFMSPRILPILPGTEKGRKHFLSPTLFSFHEKDGLLPLPNILKSLNINGDTEKDWLEILLTVSGASKTLDDLVKKLEPEMKEMNEKVYPAILDLEKIEENWNFVQRSYSEDQRKDIDENGYAFLEPEQIQLLYNNQYGRRLNLDLEKYSILNKFEKQERIDSDIRKLAKLDESEINRRERIRRKRQSESHGSGEPTGHENTATGDHNATHEGDSHEGGHHGPIHMITLEPWAFGSRVGTGVALEAITLSPYAFFSEIMMPEALVVQTLGPRAFVPAILSPSALIARILSPAAFRAEVLSPRALTLFLLTPEALLAEVLSPKFLEARILSPEALIIQVLSPSLIVPRVLSPEAGALLILSPSILSPRILSGETLTVEIQEPRSPWEEIHNEGPQNPFGQAHIEEQGLNLGEGEVREVDLGQIRIQENNFNEIHDNSDFFFKGF
ncbi:hypothetical protein FO519_003636 [Halicephalobus sp. NKZ332]|nr:hypothetical protein FO519_003636 [Halicephalobus sp. NKZ332]